MCVRNVSQLSVIVQGAKRQGLKQHIKVRKNVENAGIGLVSPDSLFGGCSTLLDHCFDI